MQQHKLKLREHLQFKKLKVGTWGNSDPLHHTQLGGTDKSDECWTIKSKGLAYADVLSSQQWPTHHNTQNGIQKYRKSMHPFLWSTLFIQI